MASCAIQSFQRQAYLGFLLPWRPRALGAKCKTSMGFCKLFDPVLDSLFHTAIASKHENNTPGTCWYTLSIHGIANMCLNIVKAWGHSVFSEGASNACANFLKRNPLVDNRTGSPISRRLVKTRRGQTTPEAWAACVHSRKSHWTELPSLVPGN